MVLAALSDRAQDRALFLFGMIKSYLIYKYYKRIGYRLNLKNPTTFNDKLNWIKLIRSQSLLYHPIGQISGARGYPHKRREPNI